MKTFFRILFNSLIWIRPYKFDKEWDTKLNELLDKFDFVKPNRPGLDEYVRHLGDETIWIANHPYSSFHKHDINQWPPQEKPKLPSRKTVFRAYDKLVEDDKHVKRRSK